MKFRNLVPAVAAVFALGTSVAFATPSTLTGSYTITAQYSKAHGGPSITKVLSHPFSINLTAGTETTPTKFFTTSPASSCSGGGCSGNKGTETDLLTIDFSNLDVTGIGSTSSPVEQQGTFTAKYSGAELSCAVDDGVSPHSGDTDCFVWNGAADTYNGSTMLSESLGGGYDLDLYFYNATDWNITPTVGFELVQTPPPDAPEPATLTLFAAGLAALGWGVRRRRKVS